jgi:GNAT superfamily N-acetyltransferase
VITLRQCVTDDDYEVWLAVRRAVLPDERAPSLDELKTSIKPGDAHLLADLDGELAGSGLMNRSDLGGAHVAPRVLPDKRGGGVGTALLKRLADLAGERGFERAGSHVAGADERSIAFARRFGFEETRRDVKQVLDLDVTPAPAPCDFDEVEFVSIESRPELLREAWPLAQQG